MQWLRLADFDFQGSNPLESQSNFEIWTRMDTGEINPDLGLVLDADDDPRIRLLATVPPVDAWQVDIEFSMGVSVSPSDQVPVFLVPDSFQITADNANQQMQCHLKTDNGWQHFNLDLTQVFVTGRQRFRAQIGAGASAFMGLNEDAPIRIPTPTGAPFPPNHPFLFIGGEQTVSSGLPGVTAPHIRTIHSIKIDIGFDEKNNLMSQAAAAIADHDGIDLSVLIGQLENLPRASSGNDSAANDNNKFKVPDFSEQTLSGWRKYVQSQAGAEALSLLFADKADSDLINAVATALAKGASYDDREALKLLLGDVLNKGGNEKYNAQDKTQFSGFIQVAHALMSKL